MCLLKKTKTEKCSLPLEKVDLYGVFYDESHGFLRMPYNDAKSVGENVLRLNEQTAGGRIRFSTDSDFLELQVNYPSVHAMNHFPLSGSSSFLLLQEDKETTFVHNFILPIHFKKGIYRERTALSKGMHSYILYFPLYNPVRNLKIKLSRSATLTHGKAYKPDLPILYYGSSITQGGCASRPDLSYQALLSKWTNIDYINLGFSGSCKAETAMAEYLSKLPCSLFVYDYDHNATDADFLRKTHENLYKIFRSYQKDTPVLFLTKPDCDTDPHAEERKAVIYQTYQNAKNRGENVTFLDGKTLFSDSDREKCFVDGCHPNDLGFYRMAEQVLHAMQNTSISSIL